MVIYSPRRIHPLFHFFQSVVTNTYIYYWKRIYLYPFSERLSLVRYMRILFNCRLSLLRRCLCDCPYAWYNIIYFRTWRSNIWIDLFWLLQGLTSSRSWDKATLKYYLLNNLPIVSPPWYPSIKTEIIQILLADTKVIEKQLPYHGLLFHCFLGPAQANQWKRSVWIRLYF